ncbi:MAG: tol-pal system-associated acyl-CoA thioesterase [Azoarcus sp.]|jgi:acyl-CoA thioester hydrolase|nr:tol-pal system-associated acyl-CoA thioesterase [Azoarcus sp.]
MHEPTFSTSAAVAASPPPGSVLPVRVYYEDTDAGGVVYYANYLRFCERARTEYLRALGFEQERLLRDGGFVFVVRSVHADYLSPAKLDDSLTITSSVSTLHPVSIYFLQRITRGDTLLFTAEIKIVCVSVSTGRPLPWPDALRDCFHAQLSPDPAPAPRP